MATEFSPLLTRLVVRPRRSVFRSAVGRPDALAGAALMVMVAIAVPADAQSGGKGFLFKKPVGSFSIRGGYAIANARSGVFDDATSLLTLNKRDFSGFDWGGDISYAASPRWDIVFDGEVSSASRNSEYRDFIDNNDQPIAQATKFRRIPLTIGLKYYITDRGRAVSQFAYIPSRYAPYVGIAAGSMWYRFAQNGDFIDFDTPDQKVRSLTVEGSGWTPMAHGMAGLDYTIGPWLALTTEARYQWAKARLDPDSFVDYDKIDLTGFTGTVGFRVRF